LLFAAAIAIWRAPKGKSSRIWILVAVGILIVLLSLLVAAGVLAPSGQLSRNMLVLQPSWGCTMLIQDSSPSSVFLAPR
jgi:hypothetical protein